MSVVMRMQERGQITLPKKVREEMGLVPGDHVVAIPDGKGGYSLERIRPMTIDEMYERVGNRVAVDAKDIDQLIQKAMEEEADEFARRLEESGTA